VITGETIPSMQAAIRDYLAPSVLGLDPSDREECFARLEKAMAKNTSAKAALEAGHAELEAVKAELVAAKAEIETLKAELEVAKAAVVPAEEPAPAELTASAAGFHSDVVVTIVLDAEGAIAELTVDSSGETPSIGTRCAEDEAFLAQFIGKVGPFEGVDAVAGATVTSEAVVEALNSLFAK
jgi:Na+-translocating ferredoxin:NAD+ oxidoreductase RnfG subunit